MTNHPARVHCSPFKTVKESLLHVRSLLMEGKGSLEEQLEAVKSKASEIATKKETLRKVEELGASTEEALIFDNK